MKIPLLAILFVAALVGVGALTMSPASVVSWLYCRGHIDNILEVGPRLSWAVDRQGTWHRRLRAAHDRHPDC